MTPFITFEGVEGSGKSSQIVLLAAELERRDYRVLVTREPGGTTIGETLRRILLEYDEPMSPEAEAYLMTGARAEHVRRVIGPALDDGQTVLCDRFADSTFAYQGAGRGLPVEQLRRLQELGLGRLKPGLTILLDVPVEVGLARRGGTGVENRIDREQVEFHERVAEWYRREADLNSDRWVTVDGTKPPLSVHTVILECVLSRFETDSVVRQGSGTQ